MSAVTSSLPCMFGAASRKSTGLLSTPFIPGLTGPLAHWLPHALRGLLPPLAYVIPVMEFATGLGLLSVRARPVAVILALVMHLFILTCLGPWGLDWNSVVWPWNIAMMLFVVVLFWRDRTPFLRPLLRESLHVRRFPIASLAVLLCGGMPLFSFWNHWDSYLSMTLYSGDTVRAEIDLAANDVPHLPPAVQRYAVIEGDTAVVNIQTWSLGITNAPPYPEMRVYKNVARSVCGELGPAADMQLVTLESRTGGRGNRKNTPTAAVTCAESGGSKFSGARAEISKQSVGPPWHSQAPCVLFCRALLSGHHARERLSPLKGRPRSWPASAASSRRRRRR